jgi:hypothetical protein
LEIRLAIQPPTRFVSITLIRFENPHPQAFWTKKMTSPLEEVTEGATRLTAFLRPLMKI